jgi:hypothetical protein
MNMEWISEKGSSLISFAIVLAFVGLSFFHSQYRYLYLVVALGVLMYGIKKFKKRDTPFERHERELRRKSL